MKHHLLALVAATFSLSTAMAQEKRQNAIDDEYYNCLHKDTTKTNICNCAYIAYGKWDGEMNAAYKRLLKALRSDKDKAALKQAQAAWVAYRNAEFHAYDLMFNIAGNKWCSLRQDNRIELVKQRTLQFRAYDEALRNK